MIHYLSKEMESPPVILQADLSYSLSAAGNGAFFFRVYEGGSGQLGGLVGWDSSREQGLGEVPSGWPTESLKELPESDS